LPIFGKVPLDFSQRESRALRDLITFQSLVTVNGSISTQMERSQITQTLWEISGECCPRIMVVDGPIRCVSIVDNPRFPATKLWIPSPIGFIASLCFSSYRQFKSLVFEDVPILERIETRIFSKTSLRSVALPRSVEILGEECFLECGLLSSVTIESESKLSRIENWAFAGSRLLEIVILASVEVLSEKCFLKCNSL
jgi:hypothetical protein